jgi:hypothetical protein
MGKVFFALAGLVIGGIAGAGLGGTLIGGTAAGFGVATGLSAGICSTVTAAVEEGLLTEDQVEQVLARAATDLGGTVDEELVNSVSQCEEVMQTLLAAETD